MIKILLITLLFMFTFWNCHNTPTCDSNNTSCFYYENGNIESKVNSLSGLREGISYYYYEDGDLKSIQRFKNDKLHGEILYFYPNGKIETKTHFESGLETGKAYYFYESGILEAQRSWENNKKIGFATDYYDTIGLVKSVLFYSNDGILIYKKNFDRMGNYLNTEGEKPF